MRIAQIAPLYESVPPKTYGGTERIVSYLTEMLVEMGHDVTLFASGDSKTSATFSAQTPLSLRLDDGCIDPLVHHVLMLERVFQQADEFDIIHSHIDYLPFPLARLSPAPVVTTLHGRLDMPDLVPLYREFSEQPLISISNSQRKPLPWANWIRTVYHGLPEGHYSLNRTPEQYLAFIGRISPEKRLDLAIEIAIGAGVPLKIAAKIDKVDKEYYRETIRPLLGHPLIEYVGEIGEREKGDFIGNAIALLAPIDWPEPFGLVFIEAMACGTPVLTRPMGSVPELIEQGVTGFIFETVEEGIEAVRQIPSIDRDRCREVFERRFTSRRMASDYLEAYLGLSADFHSHEMGVFGAEAAEQETMVHL
ncbi:MAG: glycosyltransferase family 4 protein [Desulfobacteraceae bacterium]|nr:MAG: glycosyltransferase family 4 protein [Desulfobacteraceae bacterium]